MDEASMVLIPTREDDYNTWLSQHPHGFVINAPKTGPEPMYWHRADCETIQPYKGMRHVEGGNLKVCSLNPGALAVWAVSRGGKMNYCQECRDRWLKEQQSTNVFRLGQ